MASHTDQKKYRDETWNRQQLAERRKHTHIPQQLANVPSLSDIHKLIDSVSWTEQDRLLIHRSLDDLRRRKY